MTQEEKAKRYDETLERAKLSRLQLLDIGEEATEIEYIFPELAESEDEKIKEDLIQWINEFPDTIWRGHYKKDVLAWLEKQGKEEYALKSFKDEDVRKFMQYIEKEAKAYEFNLPNRSYDIYAFAKDILYWLEKQGEKKPIIEMKSAEESLCIDSDTYNKIDDECIWGEQKSNPCDGCINRKGCINCENGDMKETEHRVEPKFKVGDTMRTLQEADDGYTDGMPVVVSIDNEYYHCTNELIAIKDQDDYEFPPINVKQKSADKVEPKFEIEKGKWYVCNTSRYTDFIVGKAYYCPKNGMLKPNENAIARYVARDCFHSWTIQDANDGDVLTYKNDDVEWILIYKYIIPESFDVPHAVLKYHALFTGTDFYDSGIAGMISENYASCFTPATKEQRDLLFQKMYYAGYEWDEEKKELKRLGKQGEQKPKWTEEDEDNLNMAIYFMRSENTPYSPTDVEPVVEWLCGLKQRMEEHQ